MPRITALIRILPLVLVALLHSGAPRAYAKDARAQCAKAGDDDRVRPLSPDLKAAAESAFPGALQETTVYRCMNGAVWLCNHGANLTCAKADTRRDLPSVAAYCRENPTSDIVPMAVTGHGTIYTFACSNGHARITDEAKVDDRGFIANQWTKIAK